jgi:hypothetical protein
VGPVGERVADSLERPLAQLGETAPSRPSEVNRAGSPGEGAVYRSSPPKTNRAGVGSPEYSGVHRVPHRA